MYRGPVAQREPNIKAYSPTSAVRTFYSRGLTTARAPPLVHLLCVYLKSGRPRRTKRTHHLVRAPGGFEPRQSAALSFWLVDRYQSCSDLCVFAHRTAARRRLTNASLGSSSTGHVSSNRSRKIFHAFSMALKSWDTFGYSSTSFKPQRLKACRASEPQRHDRPTPSPLFHD